MTVTDLQKKKQTLEAGVAKLDQDIQSLTAQADQMRRNRIATFGALQLVQELIAEFDKEDKPVEQTPDNVIPLPPQA